MDTGNGGQEPLGEEAKERIRKKILDGLAQDGTETAGRDDQEEGKEESS
jgi:hypothetical protein